MKITAMELHEVERASDESIYYRSFGASRHAADVNLERLLQTTGTEQQALVALTGGDIVGVAGFERSGRRSRPLGTVVSTGAVAYRLDWMWRDGLTRRRCGTAATLALPGRPATDGVRSKQ